MTKAWGKLSKVLLFVCVSSKLNLPPNTCIPRRLKIMMKRKSSSSREAMDFMEFSRDATKLLRDAQWLKKKTNHLKVSCALYKYLWYSINIISILYRVTLKILRSRTQRNTEMPRDDMTSNSTKKVSVMPPHTTKQSKRLNRDTK